METYNGLIRATLDVLCSAWTLAVDVGRMYYEYNALYNSSVEEDLVDLDD